MRTTEQMDSIINRFAFILGSHASAHITSGLYALQHFLISLGVVLLVLVLAFIIINKLCRLQ